MGSVHCIACETCGIWMTSHCKLIFLGDNYEDALLRVNWARDRAYAYDDDGRDIEEYDFERYVSFRPDVSDALMNLEILTKIMQYFTD